jgi:hypothetical protein
VPILGFRVKMGQNGDPIQGKTYFINVVHIYISTLFMISIDYNFVV